MCVYKQKITLYRLLGFRFNNSNRHNTESENNSADNSSDQINNNNNRKSIYCNKDNSWQGQFYNTHTSQQRQRYVHSQIWPRRLTQPVVLEV